MFLLFLNLPCNLISCPNPACMCTRLHAQDPCPCPFNFSPRHFQLLTPVSSFFLSCQHLPARHVTSRYGYWTYWRHINLTVPYITLPNLFFFLPPPPRIVYHLSSFSLLVFETVQTITAIYPNFTLLDSAATSISRYITHTRMYAHTFMHAWMHAYIHTYTPYTHLLYPQCSPPLHVRLLLFLPFRMCLQIH